MAISDTKRALIDVIMLGDLQLKEGAAIAEMIESDYITEDYASDLLSLAEQLPPGDFRKVLEFEYNGNNDKSADIPMLTEEAFADARNSVLLESGDQDQSFLRKQAAKISGIPLSTLIMMYMMASPETKKSIKQSAKAAIDLGLTGYKNMQNFLRILPKIPETVDQARQQHFWQWIKFDREGVPHMTDANGFKSAHNLWATNVDGKWKPNVSKIGILALGGILAAAGITAMIIAISKYFSKTSREIRKVCGKYPKRSKDYRKCSLTLKIKACDQIIAKLKQAMKECNKKSNPYKCKNSVQKNIYIWQTRRDEYAAQLARIKK